MKILLSAARRNAGLNQDQIAEKMGVSKQTISHWEVGVTKPSKADVKMFADICGVDENLLFLPFDLIHN